LNATQRQSEDRVHLPDLQINEAGLVFRCLTNLPVP
jgi:hypothetical protein